MSLLLKTNKCYWYWFVGKEHGNFHQRCGINNKHSLTRFIGGTSNMEQILNAAGIEPS